MIIKYIKSTKMEDIEINDIIIQNNINENEFYQ